MSDIGVLSQKPIDFIYKGYNETQFDNAQQFKESNNLDNLAQLLSQNQSVHVYPFWGDENEGEIAISRCDIQVQYKFEPTCVFFGAIMTDNYNNNIGHKCSASKYAGFNRHLVTGEGTIEMIRKTPDNLVEEFQIQGNRLIDGDGVWCYQIPMNLDFVGTDEYGNIVPTDDPNKGIPTRTCVRFRVSMQETGNEGVSRHRAKYLIPNVQTLEGNGGALATAQMPYIKSGKKFEQCYEFGSATPDEYYRDLYWNKVYSVKNYIPRIQTNAKKTTQNYSAIRTVNSNNDVNPVPFNHARYRLAFAYRVLCMLMTIIFAIICGLNAFISGIAGIKIITVRPFKWICSLVGCIGVSGGLTEDEDSNIEYFPCCSYSKCMSCEERGCTKETSYDALINVVQQALSQEYDTVNLDFYNDWLNGSLYMPLWFWKKTKKKKFLFGLFSKKAVNSFCSCSKNFPKLRVTQNCSLAYNGLSYLYNDGDKGKKYHEVYPTNKTFTIFGVIKEFVNKAGLNIYYYAPGIPNSPTYKETDDYVPYVRLYSTDIILLGSLNSCDLDNLPNVFTNLPTTTANVPFIATIKQSTIEEEGATYMDGTTEEEGLVEVSGMDWLHKPEKHKPKYGAGLFMDLACNAVYTKPKSCTNVERLCELGVSLDTHMEVPTVKNGALTTVVVLADGMITRYELVDNETRAMFASLNNNGLTEKIYNPNTGYFTYKLRYVYPIDFDGHMEQAPSYTSMMDVKTFDNPDDSYNEFRFGPRYRDNGRTTKSLMKFFYSQENSGAWSFPIFNNSFYFYFGIHEGSTAIDKFNSRFYATCYKNSKYPFTMTVTTESAKWCPKDNTYPYEDYAAISVMLKSVKTPYSYTLYNEFNEEIVQEDGLYVTELNFGYSIVRGGGDYEYDNNGKLIKNGIFSEFNTGEKVLDSNGNEIKVENGTYKLEVTDVNGNSSTQTIVIDQIPINITYETVELGEKYYSDEISKRSDFCNKNEFFGEIRVSAFTIDGHDYYVKNVSDIENVADGEYRIKVYNDNNDEECVYLQVVPQPLETDENGDSIELTLSDCGCEGTSGYGTARVKGVDGINVLIFTIWKPNTFTITVTQICPCDGELNDNSTNVMAVVKNGQTFNAYFNEMPLKFILGKNEQVSSYNPKFYLVGATTPSQLPGWFGLHDESSYVFSATTTAYADIWSDYVTVTTEQNPENTTDTKYYMSDETIYNILKYKFEKMFNLSKTCYVAGDQDNKMTLTHTGGKAPILYRGHYPKYSDISEENTPDNMFTLKEYDSEASTTLSQYYPNVVGKNYTYLHPESGTPQTMFTSNQPIPYFNKDYSDYKNTGNYFAAFSRNGGIIVGDDEDDCTQDKNVKYQQIPYSATPIPNGIDSICPSTDEEIDGNYLSDVYKGGTSIKPYFRGEFVDRRLDYRFIIFTPYAGDDSPIISSNDIPNTNDDVIIPLWKMGRFSGYTNNGIEMVYDNSYEIIGVGKRNVYLSSTATSATTVYYPLEYVYGADLNLNLNDFNSKEALKEALTSNSNSAMMFTGYTDYIDNNVKTYYNSNLKYKRYYKTILKTSNKKNDINDFFWAGKTSVERHPGMFIGYDRVLPIGCDLSRINTTNMFSYDHSTEFGGTYNGDFSTTSYPTRRLLDIGNVPSCEKLTFTCSSCSYEIDVDMNDVDEITYMTGTTEECGETEFSVDCRNMIEPVESSLEECASNRSYNVQYTYSDGMCYSSGIKIRCKLKNDTYNSTHSVYSLFPRLFWIKRKDKDENSILDIKHKATSISDMKSMLNSCNIARFGYNKSTVKDIKTIDKKYFWTVLTGNYWVNSSDDKKIAYDDNSNVKNVVYTVSTNVKNYDVLGVYISRYYINDSGDNLTKAISTVQITSIYDVRPFKFDLYCTKIETDSRTTSTASTTVGSVEIPNYEPNDEGELEQNGTTSSSAPTANTTVSSATETQRTIYRIITYIDSGKTNNGTAEIVNWNQQFYEINDSGGTTIYDVSSLSAAFAVMKLYTNDVIITSEKVNEDGTPNENGKWLAIYFDVMWNGNLGGATLNKIKGNPYAFIYIEMPNKLIYQLKFKLKDITSKEECESTSLVGNGSEEES